MTVLAVRLVVGVAVTMVALLRFNGSRSERASEMPMRTSVRVSVDVTPVPMDDACRRTAHSGHTVATLRYRQKSRRKNRGQFRKHEFRESRPARTGSRKERKL